MRITRLMILYKSSSSEDYFCKVKCSDDTEHEGYFANDQIKVGPIVLFSYVKSYLDTFPISEESNRSQHPTAGAK